jgi:excisionase family DNA binding protein
MLVGVSTTTLDAWIRAKRFPQPMTLGTRTRRWRKSTIDTYLASLAGGAA